MCVRRAGRGPSSAGRGVLSMSGLSYGVVRVDAENSLTSLTLQDCGQVMPSCKCNDTILVLIPIANFEDYVVGLLAEVIMLTATKLIGENAIYPYGFKTHFL